LREGFGEGFGGFSVKHVSPRTNLRRTLASQNAGKAPQEDSDRLGAATVGRSKKNPAYVRRIAERSFLFLTLVLFLCLTKENINNKQQHIRSMENNRQRAQRIAKIASSTAPLSVISADRQHATSTPACRPCQAHSNHTPR
jgi:hypothetical protein